ncbi:type VI secretion system baseplate subunit TssK [Janthinobacterium sp. PC23-8]|uniref:type VI secretion system baseplate subunit TssK n=1 Tax=Janthinobacterium sp. PC23-8 TaxID=2012679 RepID=UPI000B96A40A|nr:type VI secretion system baseplate subunit TssK [Janthinobacterium sp. PC23-8]OYO27940.1 type VI secretion system-associated protein [Janthinobacterium sp. PC23-8]
MDDKQAIYWHQGMFMQPQHFQIADLHGQFRNKPLMEAGLPHFWGVGALSLSAAAVANRTIEIEQAQLLFGERSYIEYPGNAAIAPRSFDSSWVEGDKPFTVYLGLKKLSAQEPNATLAASLHEAAGATTRYASLDNPPEVQDLYSDGPVAQVRTLLHVLKVFFESEVAQLGGYDLIPVARLVREGDSIRLDDKFIPPCYAMSGSPVLLRVVKDVRDELAGRARQLQEYKSPGELQKAEFDASYIVFLLALSALNRASPYLYHLTETPQVHPWLAYGALRQLVGELSSFSERFNMLGEAADGKPGLPPYDHVDLHHCFARAHALISSLLNDITVGPEFLAVLQYQDGQHVCALPHNFFDRRNRFYLVVRSEHDPVDTLLRDARLATGEDIPGLIAHALPGLELIHMATAPQGLPRRAHSYYFRIEQVSQLWYAVERQGSIALQWPDAPADMKAEIVVLRK